MQPSSSRDFSFNHATIIIIVAANLAEMSDSEVIEDDSDSDVIVDSDGPDVAVCSVAPVQRRRGAGAFWCILVSGNVAHAVAEVETTCEAYIEVSGKRVGRAAPTFSCLCR